MRSSSSRRSRRRKIVRRPSSLAAFAAVLVLSVLLGAGTAACAYASAGPITYQSDGFTQAWTSLVSGTTVRTYYDYVGGSVQSSAPVDSIDSYRRYNDLGAVPTPAAWTWYCYGQLGYRLQAGALMNPDGTPFKVQPFAVSAQTAAIGQVSVEGTPPVSVVSLPGVSINGTIPVVVTNAAEIGSAVGTSTIGTVTASFVGTVPVNPWDTADLPRYWQVVLVSLVVIAASGKAAHMMFGGKQ